MRKESHEDLGLGSIADDHYHTGGTRNDGMKWPRGRYNGMRIVGLEVKFRLCFTSWRWKPFIGGYCGALHWGPFMSWWGFDYDQFEHVRQRRDTDAKGTDA